MYSFSPQENCIFFEINTSCAMKNPKRYLKNKNWVRSSSSHWWSSGTENFALKTLFLLVTFFPCFYKFSWSYILSTPNCWACSKIAIFQVKSLCQTCSDIILTSNGHAYSSDMYKFGWWHQRLELWCLISTLRFFKFI